MDDYFYQKYSANMDDAAYGLYDINATYWAELDKIYATNDKYQQSSSDDDEEEEDEEEATESEQEDCDITSSKPSLVDRGSNKSNKSQKIANSSAGYDSGGDDDDDEYDPD